MCMSLFGSAAMAQQVTDTTRVIMTGIHVITTQDGGEFVGRIVSDDGREVIIETENLGRVIIPKYQIKEMRRQGVERQVDLGNHAFATRYFLTTNGLSVPRGASYIQWNTYGPNFQFGISERLGIGIITSWFGVPLIGNLKYSFELDESTHVALGTLLGTGSWTAPDFGIALPFGAITLGNRRNNLTLSAGYGTVWESGRGEGNALFALGGMTQVGSTVSLVFDSIVMPTVDDGMGFALIIPGVRFQDKRDQAFQFGFVGFIVDGEVAPAPFPMVQWYRMF